MLPAAFLPETVFFGVPKDFIFLFALDFVAINLS
jgi:hypothetical protein